MLPILSTIILIEVADGALNQINHLKLWRQCIGKKKKKKMRVTKPILWNKNSILFLSVNLSMIKDK